MVFTSTKETEHLTACQENVLLSSLQIIITESFTVVYNVITCLNGSLII